MHFIVVRHIVTAALVAFASNAFAAEPAPPVLNEPVLGLRYQSARVAFDPLPAHALANCETMKNNGYSDVMWFIHAQTTDSSGRTYYVSGGYEIRKDAPRHLKYETRGLGSVFFTDRGTCTYIDTARQVFEDRLFDEELPETVLRSLALDFARRLVKAFGGPDRLRAELKNQHVDKDALPPELLSALKPYLPD